MGPAAIIGGGLSIVSGVMGMFGAKKREREARKERKRLQGKLNSLEANRQEIVNPYQDLSSMVSNPFATLSVATGAAEMQIEEADISLANTLDTLRATGASAGGATALAQAALQSKKGVAASIEMQEKQNEDKRAQGEKQKQNQLMSEAQRVQQGEAYEFGLRETRQMQELDRTSAMLGASRQAEAQAGMDATGALTGALGTLGGMAATPGFFK
jgi:predicted nuclease with TOPRIM domain